MRALALRAYLAYGHYLVELMRLPSMAPERIARYVPDLDAVEVKRLWQEAPGGGGLIFAVAHMGSNEAVAASIAHHGMPISVVADDSSFPELFELLRRQREGWGVTIIPWRNLREIFGVLRRREMLGLLVDWGYRPDGIPVQLFGAWTALPAGPATLAAKTGSRILPITIHRQPDGTIRRELARPDRCPRHPIPPSSSARPRPSPTRSPPTSARRPTSGTASSRSGRATRRRSPTWSGGPGSCRPASTIRDRRGAAPADPLAPEAAVR